MNAINRKNFDAIVEEFGSDPVFTSNNSLLADIAAEVASENKVPFNIGPSSATDESVTKYFANSYAYVKFSK